MLDLNNLKRILLIRLTGLGDVINTLPCICAIREKYPTLKIDFLVEDRCKDIIFNHPYLNYIHIFPRKRWQKMLKKFCFYRLFKEVKEYIKNLQKPNYDLVIDFHGNFKSGVHTYLTKSKIRIGYSRKYSIEFNYLFNNLHFNPASGEVHIIEKYFSLLKPLGIILENIKFELPSINAEKKIKEFILRNNLEKYIVIHPGTSKFGKKKRWSLEKFLTLSKILAKKYKVVISWGPAEKEIIAKFQQLNSNIFVSPETSNLLNLAYIIKNALIFISADTGPMHLANAVDIPCCAIFGPENPKVYGPYSFRTKDKIIPHRIIKKDNTTENISVEDVYNEVNKILISQD